MKKISIIIPVYNTEKYLERCLESACNQTYKNLEIICIDDGSTDKSSQIIDKFAENDIRVVAIHQENQGEWRARNYGLSIAKGEYIGFMDCDDWIETDMYEELVYALEKENADMAVGGWFKDTENSSIPIKNEKKVENNVFSGKKLLEYIYERDSYREFAYMWDKLYKRELFYDGVGDSILFNTQLILGNDALFLGRLALNTNKAVYVSKPFYHYIQREDSGSHTKNVEKLLDWVKSYEILIDIFEKNNVDKFVLVLVKRFLVYHSANVAQLAYEQKNNEALLYCLGIIRKYKKEYQQSNKDKPERIDWINKIISYRL